MTRRRAKLALILLLGGVALHANRVPHTSARQLQYSDAAGGKVRVVYDEQADKTLVLLQLEPFGDSSEMCRSGWTLIAETGYAGRTPQPPANVELGFFAPPDADTAGREVTAVIDGERLELGKLAHRERDFRQSPGCRNLYDTLGLSVPREKFLRIAKAQQAELHAGETVLPLTAAHLKALRAFAGQLGQ